MENLTFPKTVSTIDRINKRNKIRRNCSNIKQNILLYKNEESSNDEKKEYESKKKEMESIQNLKEYLIKNNALKEDFELLDFVDSGGESNVYSIQINYKHKSGQNLKKKAILKVIFDNRKNNQNEHKREAIIAAKLKNRNIINFLGYSIIDPKESCLMILDEARYGNVRNFQRKILNRPVFSESMINYICYQVLNALQYCHRCKIAHMDLKLQNIVADEYLNFKLIDFSISLNYQNKNPNDDIKLPSRGTNFYIPLEVLKSKTIKVKELNKVDLYSLGVVLYNLAFGNYPYQMTYGDDSDFQIIERKLENEKLTFSNEKEYSSYFLDFLSKLLERDIKKRIGLNEALNHYWTKGADLLMEEKEKAYNVSIFASYLLTNHIKSFNDYIQMK